MNSVTPAMLPLVMKSEPLASVVLPPGKPWKTFKHGTKVGSSVPACGNAFGLGLGQPVSGVLEKYVPRQPAWPPPKATGRNGVSNDN